MKQSSTYLRALAKGLFALLALGALLLLWYRAQAFDPLLYGRVQTTLGQIETTWAEVAEDVLRVRHGLGRNYDSLVHNLGRLGALTRSLKTADGGVEGLHSAEVQGEINSLERAIAQKGVLIEHFKTRNAMLRNALLYFPKSIDRVSTDPETDPELQGVLRSVRVGVLDLHLGQPGVSQRQVEERLEQLSRLADLYPDAVSEALRRIGTYGRLIVTIERELEEQLPAIVNKSQRILVGGLSSAYATEYRRRILVKNLYQIGLFATALGLLVFGVWTHLRLRSRSRELAEALNWVENQKHALDEHAIVSSTDVDGIITYANQKFCDISGYSREELLGKNHRIVNSGVHPRALFREMWRTIRKGQTWHGEVMNRSRDGSGYWVAATVVPFLDDGGKPYQYVSIRTDITARKQAEEKLHQALEQAHAASRAKSDFLATMSHEIRTPMNGVLGMLQLLQDTPLTGEQREFADIARSSAQALLSLIDDILDFSKIEAGSLDVDSVPFGLRELLMGTLKTLTFQADAKGLRLDSSVAVEVPDRLLGDPGRLRQILLNLLGNAIKFTGRGEVGVEVALEDSLSDSAQEDGQPLMLLFTVSDTGIGISRAAREKVFEAFSQADMSVSRGYGGTGLGLSISARLVELMGGRIWLESQPDQGSRFFFTIAVSVAPAELSATDDAIADNSPPWRGEPGDVGARRSPEEAKAVSPSSGDGATVRVLVVEDFHINQILITAILKKRHCEITLAENGREALDQFTPGRYDLVLMDVQMPEMDGFEATGLIREREAETAAKAEGKGAASTMIVAMTANAMKGDRERCLAAGMDGYIAKPFNPGELLDVVDRLQAQLSADGRLQPVAADAADTPPSPPSVSADGPVDRAYALGMVGGDETLLAVTINAFLGEYPLQLAQIGEAREGRDPQQAVRAVHSLKGLLGGVGALEAQSQARELEALGKSGDWLKFEELLPRFEQSLEAVARELRPEGEESGEG